MSNAIAASSPRLAACSMEGPFTPSQPENVAAITGGTGRYSTAQGEIVVSAEADQIVVKLVR